MKQLPTAAEVRRMVEDLDCLANRLCADGSKSDGLVAEAGYYLEQFATWLTDQEEMSRIMQEANEAKFERGISRAKFKPCCDGTDYRCSICGGIVRYDDTPPEGE